MGKIREKFRKHLNCTDDELKEILMPFRFKKGINMNDLTDRINEKLFFYGFEIIDKTSNINKYTTLIKTGCVRFGTDFLIFNVWFFLIFVFLQWKFHFDDFWWFFDFDFFIGWFWCCFIDFVFH